MRLAALNVAQYFLEASVIMSVFLLTLQAQRLINCRLCNISFFPEDLQISQKVFADHLPNHETLFIFGIY